jgi:acetylornithine deacetylase/succinyl-diaminopimelate desuccinylase-like protein
LIDEMNTRWEEFRLRVTTTMRPDDGETGYLHTLPPALMDEGMMRHISRAAEEFCDGGDVPLLGEGGEEAAPEAGAAERGHDHGGDVTGQRRSAGGGWTVMPSGAGHDAQRLAEVMPAAMLFVPSIEGISHNFDENTSEPHL